KAVSAGRLDPSLLFEAAVSQDVDRFDEIARVEPDYHGVLRGLASLIAMPMLQACWRAWPSVCPRAGRTATARFVVAGLLWQKSADSTLGIFDVDAAAATGGPSVCAVPSVARAITKSWVLCCRRTAWSATPSRCVTGAADI